VKTSGSKAQENW